MADDQTRNEDSIVTTGAQDVKAIEDARKPYEPPRLEVFGDLGAVTQAVNLTGKNDGSKGLMSKT